MKNVESDKIFRDKHRNEIDSQVDITTNLINSKTQSRITTNINIKQEILKPIKNCLLLTINQTIMNSTSRNPFINYIFNFLNCQTASHLFPLTQIL